MISRIIIIVDISLVLGLIGIYTGLRIWIKSDVDQICDRAINQYEGDKIEALIFMLGSEKQSLKDKNDVIRALAHLRDKRALPFLQELQTGTECDHNKYVCQRELNKTMAYLEGKSLNLMRFK